MRSVINLNKGWRFHKGDIIIKPFPDKGPVYAENKTERKRIGPAAYYYFDEPDCYGRDYEIRNEGWQNVDLPHDYVIDQDNDKSENNANGYVHYDNAWYRKHFTIDEKFKDKHIILEFDGITGKSTVYLNGCLMKHNYSSYNSFFVDISDMADFSRENVLAIYVDTSEPEGWWYQGGGIYRDVRMVVTEPVSIDRYGVYAPCEKVSDTDWNINYEISVRNDGLTDEMVIVRSILLDKNANQVSVIEDEACVSPFEIKKVCFTDLIKNPTLWDTENPYLYTVKTQIFAGNEMIDELDTRIGFRTVVADAKRGLLLNDKPVFIKGVCCHQDFGLTGLAVPENIVKYKVKLIKEMGSNGFRTSHYMNSSYVLDALDEEGFLVMDETRWFESTDEAMEQLKELVLRDRNRPSVILWSTGNEEQYHTRPMGAKIQRNMYHLIRTLDSQRLITTAQSCTPEESTVFDYCDIIGINYNLESYARVHEQYPDKLVISSECCATGTTRDWYFPANTEGRIRDKDRDTNIWFKGREKTWRFFMENPYIVGCYQWDSIEHRGEAVWPSVCSKSGAIDLFLQKKGAFYQNKSLWSDEPLVYIVSHWNFSGLEGKDILLPVYTNCDKLELYLNDNLVESTEVEEIGHGEFTLPFEKGKITVKGYKNGLLVCEDERVTTGKPSKLKLELNCDIKNKESDIALFTCTCLDENGNRIIDADEIVSFTTDETSKIVGTGSDNSDHSAVGNTTRKMYMGKISVAVKPGEKAENIVLYAHSSNLGYAHIEISL